MSVVMRGCGRSIVDVDSEGNAYLVVSLSGETVMSEVMRGTGRIVMDYDASTGFAYPVIKLATGSSIKLQSASFTESGDFLVPAGVTTAYFSGCGAGGGGGGGHTADPGGGGGGGGGASCISMMPVSVTPGATLTITIPAAAAGGAAGAQGVAGGNTVIAGLPIGTYTIPGATVRAEPGTATNGGKGGSIPAYGLGGATGTGDGASSSVATPRDAGSIPINVAGGGAGGGPSSSGGSSAYVSGYTSFSGINPGSASGTKGGGGAGGSSIYGAGAVGGSNAVGATVATGYGTGGGGGAATFAGGDGTPGILVIAW